MNKIKITIPNTREVKNIVLTTSINFEELRNRLTGSVTAQTPILFETETGAMILPYAIWSNSIIELT